MPTGIYERYGLLSNPFRDLASESATDIDLYHVDLPIDTGFRSLREEIWEKENRALVALVGALGTGKSERLLLTAAEAKARGALCVQLNITTKLPRVLQGLLEAVREALAARGNAKVFGSPKSYRELAKLAAAPPAGIDPVRAGSLVGQVLSENAPSFLLLNDLQNLTNPTELEPLEVALRAIVDASRPGVLVMFGCHPEYYLSLVRTRPRLATVINRAIMLPTLKLEEAEVLLAKRMVPRRLVEELDPIYPFDHASVAALNYLAQGNPRRLLEFANLALEYGADHRTSRIDSEVVKNAIRTREGTAAALAKGPLRPPQQAEAPSEPAPATETSPELPGELPPKVMWDETA